MKKRLAAFVQECCRIPRFITTISKCALICSLVFAAIGAAEAATQTTTLTISGQNNVVISGLTISTTSGDCIDIVNSTNVTIQASQIGPCGSNNSTNTSRGISITGSSGVNIYDSYIHVENIAGSCGDTHDGIFITNSNGPIAIQGNVIAFNERNIRVWDASNVSVIGNFLLNPRGAATCSNPDNAGGQQFQAWADDATPNSNMTVSNNYALGSTSTQYKYPGNLSDSINFGVTNGIVAQNNWISGGSYQNACGLIADYKAYSAQFINNVISNAFNCGIGIASGTNHMVSGNKILLLQPTSPAATGITINSTGPGVCGPVSVSNNIAYAVQSSGWVQSYWSNGYCAPITLTNNTWDQAAYNILNPMTSTNPPPLVPPQPFSCVVTSPYSTQTSAQPCSGAASPPPPPPPPPPPAAQPTAALTASPTSISSGQSSSLTWSSTNATSCTGAGFTASGASGSASVTPAATSTYSINCAGSGGSASASATVTVSRTHGKPHK